MTLIAAVALLCMPHAEMVGQLDTLRDQKQIVIAQENRGGVLQFFVSKSGAWSMIVVDADLNACLIASGTRWMMMPSGQLS